MYTNVNAALSLHAMNTCFSDGQRSQNTEPTKVGKSLISFVSSKTYLKKKKIVNDVIIKIIIIHMYV